MLYQPSLHLISVFLLYLNEQLTCKKRHFLNIQYKDYVASTTNAWKVLYVFHDVIDADFLSTLRQFSFSSHMCFFVVFKEITNFNFKSLWNFAIL